MYFSLALSIEQRKRMDLGIYEIWDLINFSFTFVFIQLGRSIIPYQFDPVCNQIAITDLFLSFLHFVSIFPTVPISNDKEIICGYILTN